MGGGLDDQAGAKQHRHADPGLQQAVNGRPGQGADRPSHDERPNSAWVTPRRSRANSTQVANAAPKVTFIMRMHMARVRSAGAT